jgi:hypothetical protein
VTFQFTSGPSFILTFVTLAAYAFFIRAPFAEVWIALVTLYGLHAGKRLIQKLKDPRIGLEVETETGTEEPPK